MECFLFLFSVKHEMQRWVALRRFYSVGAPSVVSALLETNSRLDNVRVQVRARRCLELQGWVRKTHRTGKVSFVHLDDGLTQRSTASSPSLLQVVLPKEVSSPPNLGSAVEFRGKWQVRCALLIQVL